MVPNSRIDIRISNTEKDQWQRVADARGITLTQLIKQAVRMSVSQGTLNITPTTWTPSLVSTIGNTTASNTRDEHFSS